MEINGLKVNIVEAHSGKQVGNDLLIIHSAMAVPCRIYKFLAKYLAGKGISTLYFDPRGVGENKRHKDASMTDWANDVVAIANHFSEKNCHYLGHSVGGQIFGFMPQGVFKSVSFLCSSTGTWWKGRDLKIFLQSAFIMNIYIPLSNLFLGYTNAKAIQLGINLPKTASSEWARWCRSGNYLGKYKAQYPNYRHDIVNDKIYNIVTYDDPIATKRTNQHLKNLYSKAKFIDDFVEEDYEIGHFGYLKPGNGKHWDNLIQFMLG